MAEGPLAGLLVVALEQAVAAPYCTSRLADAGARVIKIERLEGDFARGYDRAAQGGSSYFAWLNRGKESLVLDIKAPQDRRLLDALLEQADVFVQNLAPGAVGRLGLGAAELRARRPSLITCDISSYGVEGPYAERKGYDLLLQAETGLVSVTGTPQGAGRVGVSVCDIATGMYAYQGVLEAVIERGRTGLGQSLEVSLFDSIADWMTVPLLQAEASGVDPARLGLHHVSIAPYGAYACADGTEVLISIQNEREWVSFCAKVLGDPAVAPDPRFADNSARVANRPALNAIIAAVFGALPRAALIAVLDQADIAFGAVNSVLDLAGHPHLRRIAVETPDGPVSIVAPPLVRQGRAMSPGPVPGIGQHSADIRREFLG
ncbi:CaiB/BaiF CoA transferase family protein [Phenylobacterium sp.]|uniref:CaiB/BaiF CoA transferase family protein n=1 Tax=Phenylobacterium sp. TaxID=1871053 RepID=UPI00374CBA14